ncbi:uncharacterized protein LOC144559912 [Carex rostrata]
MGPSSTNGRTQGVTSLKRPIDDIGLGQQNWEVGTIGDFNAITHNSEKLGGNQILKKKHKQFRSFVQRTRLIDLGYGGSAYTWANNQKGRDLILERLDRGLASAYSIHMFPNSKVLHLPDFSSDHLPILLKTQPTQKKERKSFQVEQWWMQDPNFNEVCERATSRGDQCWEATCTRLRSEVRHWEEGSEDPNKELKKIEQEMEHLLMQSQTDDVKDQRSRLNWSLHGDCNIKFFHSTTVVRKRRNSINAINKEDDEWAVREDEVRKEFVNFFKSLYIAGTESSDQSPIVIPAQVKQEIRRMSQQTWTDLDRKPTDQEIKGVVFELGPLCILGSAAMGQFWPSDNQRGEKIAFVPGREISENIILLKEVIHSFQSMQGGDDHFVLKADLAKAFDRLNWSYLFALLPEYGFSPTLCNWIKACITSSKFTIIFNDKGDGFIKLKRGLRQGCAMSPYLSIIAMDPLSRMLEASRKTGRLRDLKLTRTSDPLTNSMFADDLLLMGSISQHEVQEFASIISDFCQILGMLINSQKSKAWFSKV